MYHESEARYDARVELRGNPKVPRWALWVLLGILALAPRMVEVVGEPAYVHPDALHQGLEPAFRLVHGFGERAWEWREGLRSWVWPGTLAVPFWIADGLGLSGPGRGMAVAVAMARSLVAVIDVIGVLLAARLVGRVAGSWASVATVLVLSLHPAQVVMGAQPLIDVPAAAAAIWACERAFGGAAEGMDRSRATWLGVALGLTLVLRIQLAPMVLAVLAVLAWRSRPRPTRGLWLRIGVGAAVVVLAGGLLDWVTWGSPFGSTIAYLRFNLDEGQTSMGVMPASRYWDHLWLSMDLVAPLLIGLGVVGGFRRPELAVVLLAIVIPHQLVPYKVWRFLYPAQTLMFVLAVIGGAELVRQASARTRNLGMGVGLVLGLWTLAGCVRASVKESPWQTTWLFNQGGAEAVALSRGVNLAYLELGRRERLQGVVQTVLPHAAAPGLALLGNDVPVVHPLGASVDRAAVEHADAWIVRDEAGSGLDARLREWRDPQSGVAIYPPPPRLQREPTVGPSAP
jgi:hypothetical protein